jgi:hypothetical protein
MGGVGVGDTVDALPSAIEVVKRMILLVDDDDALDALAAMAVGAVVAMGGSKPPALRAGTRQLQRPM